MILRGRRRLVRGRAAARERAERSTWPARSRGLARRGRNGAATTWPAGSQARDAARAVERLLADARDDADPAARGRALVRAVTAGGRGGRERPEAPRQADRYPLGQGRRSTTVRSPTRLMRRRSVRPGSTSRPCRRTRRGPRSRPGLPRSPWPGRGSGRLGGCGAAPASDEPVPNG